MLFASFVDTRRRSYVALHNANGGFTPLCNGSDLSGLNAHLQADPRTQRDETDRFDFIGIHNFETPSACQHGKDQDTLHHRKILANADPRARSEGQICETVSLLLFAGSESLGIGSLRGNMP